MEMLADTGRVGSLDVVELNPAQDIRNQTAEGMVALQQQRSRQVIGLPGDPQSLALHPFDDTCLATVRQCDQQIALQVGQGCRNGHAFGGQCRTPPKFGPDRRVGLIPHSVQAKRCRARRQGNFKYRIFTIADQARRMAAPMLGGLLGEGFDHAGTGVSRSDASNSSIRKSAFSIEKGKGGRIFRMFRPAPITFIRMPRATMVSTRSAQKRVAG